MRKRCGAPNYNFYPNDGDLSKYMPPKKLKSDPTLQPHTPPCLKEIGGFFGGPSNLNLHVLIKRFKRKKLEHAKNKLDKTE